jgi:acetyl esterase/lipase|tara:strand:- start:377 stop:1273 length:897 start_codon:yes stop_codon:yes gene_type:complete
MIMRFFCVLLFGLGFSRIQSADLKISKLIDLWPSEVPGEKGDVPAETLSTHKHRGEFIQKYNNVTKPTLTIYKPNLAEDTGASVVICPGGGYQILAWDLEGTEVAAWLNSIGVTGVVLKYRVPRRKDLIKHDAPLQDAQRSVSLVRYYAKEWGLDSKRIGILGFSAGGHLSAAALTNYENRHYKPVDEIDKVSCRPDFGVLIYPAYLVDDGTKSRLSSELRITKNTPPVFLAHAADDQVPAEGSVRFWQELRRNGVSSELHVFTSGGHGYGLRSSNFPVTDWPRLCGDWLKSMGFLKR